MRGIEGYPIVLESFDFMQLVSSQHTEVDRSECIESIYGIQCDTMGVTMLPAASIESMALNMESTNVMADKLELSGMYYVAIEYMAVLCQEYGEIDRLDLSFAEYVAIDTLGAVIDSWDGVTLGRNMKPRYITRMGGHKEHVPGWESEV